MLVLFCATLIFFFGTFAYAQVISVGAGNVCLTKPNVCKSKVTYTLYNKAKPDGILLSDANLNLVKPALKTVFVVHGWLQKGNQGWIIQMKDAYLKIANVNLIVVDWSPYAFCSDYWPTAEVVPEIGVLFGDYIWNLASKGRVKLNNCQINGFSLGAHIAGTAGQQVQKKSGGVKIQRINGLEATSLGFEDAPPNQRLDADDAKFVQAFHTSDFGMQRRYGTVDVYFNFKNNRCGRNQPGCPLHPGVPLPSNPVLPIVFCNHIRAVVYFIYSISKPSGTLSAVRCNCLDFGAKNCGTGRVIVGEYCPVGAPPGTYYLNTNCSPPYGLSDMGGVGGSANYTCPL